MKKESLQNVYLGLGTNLGNKSENIYQALKYIGDRVGKLIACSSFFETEPEGFDSENQFINAACHIQTRFSVFELLALTKQIEIDMGRKSKSANKSYADRVIDIDLLLYGNSLINTDKLVLPHPHMHERGFVMHPLSEIAGELVHPVLKKTINELKKDLLLFS